MKYRITPRDVFGPERKGGTWQFSFSLRQEQQQNTSSFAVLHFAAVAVTVLLHSIFLSRSVTRDLPESTARGHTRASHPGDLLVPSGSARLRDSSEDLALDTQLT